MKFLMSQSEPQFVANHQYVMKNISGCYQINKELPEKVLKHCIISISDDQIIANPNVDDESLKKTVLVNRAYIAAASNHAEGLHQHLKTIAELNLVIEYNIEKKKKKRINLLNI